MSAVGVHAAAAAAVLAICAGNATAGRAQAQAARPAACRIEGVWELVSQAQNGQDQPLGGYRQRKIVARGHMMWVGQNARRDTLPLRTTADTLRMLELRGAAGTYTIAGDTYTEHLEYFFQPQMVGRSAQAKCRTVGDRWYHEVTIPADSSVGRPQPLVLSEVWRRIG